MVYSAVLRLRMNQFVRFLSELGLFRSLLVIGFLIATLTLCFKLATEQHGDLILASLTTVAIGMTHFKRADKRFLQLCFEQANRIYWFEYGLIALPILFILLFHGCFIPALGLIVVTAIIPTLPIPKMRSVSNNWGVQLIPDEVFEWKSGFRKYLPIIIGIWLLGLILSFHIAAVPLSIFVLGIIISGFYESFECIQILLAEELSARKFLRKKMLRTCSTFLAMVAPLIIAFIIFHPEKVIIPVGISLLFCITIVYLITLKYAFYQPSENSSLGSILPALGLLGIFIPIFIPVILFVTVRNYLKSISNLNQYLHDFD
jgi:uncharacterized membrane protein YhdT